MDDKFIIGVLLGMVGGSLIVANSVKARELVKKGQKEVMNYANEVKESTKKRNKNKADVVDNTEANE